MRADLDTLVIALYCAACALFPSERTPRRGRPELFSDNELLALMVAQMLLQCPLVLLCATDGTIVDFDLVAANSGERDAALALLQANPIEGATIICDKGFAGTDFEAAVQELRALLLRPSRTDEPNRPQPPIGWIRQRIESIVNSLKDQLHLERHGGRTPEGLLARITARILALCAAINLNQRLGLPSRQLATYTD